MTDMKIPMPQAPCQWCVENEAHFFVDGEKVVAVAVYCEHHEAGSLMLPASVGVWRTFSRVTLSEFMDFIGNMAKQFEERVRGKRNLAPHENN